MPVLVESAAYMTGIIRPPPSASGDRTWCASFDRVRQSLDAPAERGRRHRIDSVDLAADGQRHGTLSSDRVKARSGADQSASARSSGFHATEQRAAAPAAPSGGRYL